MGICCSSEAPREEVRRDTVTSHTVGNFTFQIHSKIHVGMLTSGSGCKRTPAWETSATREEVEKKRNEFWETQVEGSPEIWLLLRNAIAEDPEVAQVLIEEVGLKMESGLVMQIYDYLGNLYSIPPFVINEPLKYGTEKSVEKKKFEETNIEFVIRSSKHGDFPVKISNSVNVKELKRIYGQNAARLFYNGKELKDDFMLAHFNIVSGVVVQAHTLN